MSDNKIQTHIKTSTKTPTQPMALEEKRGSSAHLKALHEDDNNVLSKSSLSFIT